MREYREPSGAYTVRIPTGWECEAVKSSIAIFRSENGVGSLNLSTLLLGTNAALSASLVLAESLKDRLPDVVGTRISRTDGVDVSVAEYAHGDFWWRKWILLLGNRAVHATYNCRIGLRGEEDEEVNRIVTSIRLSETK